MFKFQISFIYALSTYNQFLILIQYFHLTVFLLIYPNQEKGDQSDFMRHQYSMAL